MTTDGTTARSVHEVLGSSRGTFEPALRDAVDSLPGSMRHVGGYHFGWWDEQARRTDANGGKAIRPTLALLSAEAVGGAEHSGIPAAVAVELVHNFSLLHDDVLDRDLTRRHRPTAWSVFGTNAAILAGDALLTLAFQVLAGSGHPRTAAAATELAGAVQALIEGQEIDTSFERRQDVELAECLDMAERKTGALMACACVLGSLLGGGGAAEVACLRTYGQRLGLAFQLVDDLLGIWGDPAVTGKGVYSDLQNRKKSLPVVAALTSGGPAGAELVALYSRAEPFSGAEMAQAARLIVRSGARAWSQAQSDKLLREAIEALGSTRLSSKPVAILGDLARMIVRRDH